MHIDVEGNCAGPDLVMIHGWGFSSAVWSTVTSHLSPHLRLHLVDLPGHGNAERPARDLQLHEMADAILDRIPANSHWLGWSLGGLVALQAALNGARLVRSLVLVGATPCFIARPDWPHGMPPAVFHDFGHQLVLDYGSTLRRFLALQALGQPEAKRHIRQLHGALMRRPAAHTDALTSGLRLLEDTDLRRQVKQIAQPALVIHGSHDKLTPFSAGRWLAEHLERGSLRECDGCGHAPFVTDPDEFARQVLAWTIHDLP